MNHGFTRWMVAPALVLALSACTPLTNADGLTPTPVPTPVSTPSPTELTAWEQEQLGSYGAILEPPALPFTKETLPNPKNMIPLEATNAVSQGDIDATETQRTLRLPKPVKSGSLSLDLACVDGTMEIINDSIGTSTIPCDGSTQGYVFEAVPEIKSLKMTVTPGTSYSVAAYETPDYVVIVD